MTDTDIRHILVQHGHDWMLFARALLKDEREKIARLVDPLDESLADVIRARK